MLNPSCAIYGARGKKQSKSVACFIRTRQAESYGLMTFLCPNNKCACNCFFSFLFPVLERSEVLDWTTIACRWREGTGIIGWKNLTGWLYNVQLTYSAQQHMPQTRLNRWQYFREGSPTVQSKAFLENVDTAGSNWFGKVSKPKKVNCFLPV